MEQSQEEIEIRIVIVDNKDGEKIILATNLSQEEINYSEMVKLVYTLIQVFKQYVENNIGKR